MARLFEGTRARGAFALKVVMQAPWSMRVQTESPLTLIAGIKGTALIIYDGEEPIIIDPGDVAVTKAMPHYTMADQNGREPTIFIDPGQECKDHNGRSLIDELMFDVRKWGNDPAGATSFVVGAYENLSSISDRLINQLPKVLVVKKTAWDSPLVQLLSDEIVKNVPGQAAVLDRLLDLLLTSVLRAWFAQQATKSSRWKIDKSDAVIERALHCLHADPSHPWTIEKLAIAVNTSRATLARRFHLVVGEPPMTFLANWRMALAADLLCQRSETIGTVAPKVGYKSQFAFSAAFKRLRGISPHEYQVKMLDCDAETTEA